MLTVPFIKKGVVIDHITAGKGYGIFKQLKLDTAPFETVLLKNIKSEKLGMKDLIKIADNIDLPLNILGLIDPQATVTIIENQKIVQKKKLELPEKITGILTCKNPRCISTTEDVETEFYLSNRKKKEYRCELCDVKYSFEKWIYY